MKSLSECIIAIVILIKNDYSANCLYNSLLYRALCCRKNEIKVDSGLNSVLRSSSHVLLDSALRTKLKHSNKTMVNGLRGEGVNLFLEVMPHTTRSSARI